MASRIHPTAVVDPSAEIGDSVEIGPYCVIHPGVVLGEGCWLQNHVTLDGPLRVGAHCRFYAFSSIGQRSQDLKYSGEPTYCEIGDGNSFREFCTVNRATSPGGKTTIGSQNHFLAYSHVAHDCQVGSHVIFSNNGTVAGHVVVEDYAILGGLSAVHQFCRIGSHSIIGGCTKIVQDVPPFMIADGNPAEVRATNQVGLERRGFSEEARRALRTAHQLLYRKNLNVSQALEEIEKLEDHQSVLASLVRFVRSSGRGIIR